MLFRFLILSDEVDDFKREIKIDSEATFLELHDAILDSVNYTKDQMTSFFICDEDWSKRTEITRVEMDTTSDEDNYVMEDTHLDELLEDEHQKLLFVFDYMTDRAFFMEAKSANTEIGEDFYGDSEYDPDELDRDGFEGLSESPFDNPYDDDRY